MGGFETCNVSLWSEKNRGVPVQTQSVSLLGEASRTRACLTVPHIHTGLSSTGECAKTAVRTLTASGREITVLSSLFQRVESVSLCAVLGCFPCTHGWEAFTYWAIYVVRYVNHALLLQSQYLRVGSLLTYMLFNNNASLRKSRHTYEQMHKHA